MKNVFSMLLVAGLFLSIHAQAEPAKVTVLSVSGTVTDATGTAVKAGAELKAEDILHTGAAGRADLMVTLGSSNEPGTLVRVTPKSRLTVLSLTQFTQHDEVCLDFEVAVSKGVSAPATLAGTPVAD